MKFKTQTALTFSLPKPKTKRKFQSCSRSSFISRKQNSEQTKQKI